MGYQMVTMVAIISKIYYVNIFVKIEYKINNWKKIIKLRIFRLKCIYFNEW